MPVVAAVTDICAMGKAVDPATEEEAHNVTTHLPTREATPGIRSAGMAN